MNEPNWSFPHTQDFISHFSQLLRAIDPTRPTCVGVAGAEELSRVDNTTTALSFHSYDGAGGGAGLATTMRSVAARASSLNKAFLLTEAMSRPADPLLSVLSAVWGCFDPPPQKRGMGFFLWELMLGVDQFNSDWEAPFQGLLFPNGTWRYGSEEEAFASFLRTPPSSPPPCAPPSRA